MVQSVNRSISLNVYNEPTHTFEALRRTNSLHERKSEDKKLISYLNHEPIPLEIESLRQLIDELSISPRCREFWFPNEVDKTQIDLYFSQKEVITEWETKYNSLLRHQVTQQDTGFLGMRRRIKAFVRVFSNTKVTETNETALDLHYLEAWIDDLSEKDYAQENLEMKLVYGIDLGNFKEEMKIADKNKDGVLSKNEFIQMMMNYHSRNNYQKSSAWERAWNAIAYADQISCSPPPLGMLS
ncbi:uncharacterized protein [Lepeophtheirus salmonis]|uniref:uncharacterized protein n=1 Tax=Lepeophtheirus salmonis TaxID=72036 RepID=UPI001AE2C48B|nr:uncharacterized protein LOC121117690 [Lepeophtheirus salmonis]